jgi:hypothetical protein
MTEQMDLFSLKYVRGSKTSLEAAIEAEPNAGTQRRRVLDVLRTFPIGLTDHELQDMLDMNPSTQRPRRVELVKAGLVKDSGHFRLTPSGRRAVVWVAV